MHDSSLQPTVHGSQGPRASAADLRSATLSLCNGLVVASDRDPSFALQVGRDALLRYRGDQGVLLAVGRLYTAAGLLDEAVRVLTDVARIDAGPEPYRLLGEALLRQGDAQIAVPMFARAITEGDDSEETRAWHVRARELARRQRERTTIAIAGDVALWIAQGALVPAAESWARCSHPAAPPEPVAQSLPRFPSDPEHTGVTLVRPSSAPPATRSEAPWTVDVEEPQVLVVNDLDPPTLTFTDDRAVDALLAAPVRSSLILPPREPAAPASTAKPVLPILPLPIEPAGASRSPAATPLPPAFVVAATRSRAQRPDTWRRLAVPGALLLALFAASFGVTRTMRSPRVGVTVEAPEVQAAQAPVAPPPVEPAAVPAEASRPELPEAPTAGPPPAAADEPAGAADEGATPSVATVTAPARPVETANAALPSPRAQVTAADRDMARLERELAKMRNKSLLEQDRPAKAKAEPKPAPAKAEPRSAKAEPKSDVARVEKKPAKSAAPREKADIIWVGDPELAAKH